MPIVLISKDEKFTEIYEDDSGGVAEFDLRRLPPAKRIEFVEKCTRRGKLDTQKLGLMVIEYCLIGWRGPLTYEGEPAALTPENINALPGPVIVFLGEKLEANLDGGLDPTKTSGSTSEQ